MTTYMAEQDRANALALAREAMKLDEALQETNSSMVDVEHAKFLKSIRDTLTGLAETVRNYENEVQWYKSSLEQLSEELLAAETDRNKWANRCATLEQITYKPGNPIMATEGSGENLQVPDAITLGELYDRMRAFEQDMERLSAIVNGFEDIGGVLGIEEMETASGRNVHSFITDYVSNVNSKDATLTETLVAIGNQALPFLDNEAKEIAYEELGLSFQPYLNRYAEDLIREGGVERGATFVRMAVGNLVREVSTVHDDLAALVSRTVGTKYDEARWPKTQDAAMVAFFLDQIWDERNKLIYSLCGRGHPRCEKTVHDALREIKRLQAAETETK